MMVAAAAAFVVIENQFAKSEFVIEILEEQIIKRRFYLFPIIFFGKGKEKKLNRRFTTHSLFFILHFFQYLFHFSLLTIFENRKSRRKKKERKTNGMLCRLTFCKEGKRKGKLLFNLSPLSFFLFSPRKKKKQQICFFFFFAFRYLSNKKKKEGEREKGGK